jgi:hypothetical protein
MIYLFHFRENTIDKLKVFNSLLKWTHLNLNNIVIVLVIRFMKLQDVVLSVRH